MFKKFLLITTTLISTTCFADEAHNTDWSYIGRTGPDHWSKLDAAYMQCNYGQTQSPINLDKENLLDNKDKIIFHYEKYDNSADITKSKHIVIGNKVYKLIKFHFHEPSEHTINHMRYPAEVHLVHVDDKGKLAVVGIFISEGNQNNQTIEDLLATIGKGKSAEQQAEDGDIMSLIPKDTQYFHYKGSLTTPPCSEGVEWYVLKTPLLISKQELKDLKKLLPDNSARPIQDDNGRVAK